MQEQELGKSDAEGLARRATELQSELQELPTKIDQAYQELFNLRFRLATKQLEDTSQIRRARKQVARLKTTMAEMQREWALISRRLAAESIHHEPEGR